LLRICVVDDRTIGGVILKGMKGRRRGLIGGLYLALYLAADAEENNENVVSVLT